MTKLIGGVLLTVGLFAALVALAGQRFGPLEIGASLLLLVAVIALLVRNHLRTRRHGSGRG
ncbi:hypothetical protein [Streptomyces sp. NPDC088915]|uniref:hypothetical protein n=1 Tax=Streptomyces sp. NPDC088915 TaxID=3365912 RepID=UPI00380E8A96